MVYKYWPRHLLATLFAHGTGRCYCTPWYYSAEVLSRSDKAMIWLTTLQICACLEILFGCQLYRMLRAFPGGSSQAQKGNYEACLKKQSFLQAGGKEKERRREELPLFWPNGLISSPLYGFKYLNIIPLDSLNLITA